MIKITITKTEVKQWAEKENVLTKETPTDKREPRSSSMYGAEERVLFEKEYAVVEVSKRSNVSRTLLEQEVDDEAFNLAAVIKAINNL